MYAANDTEKMEHSKAQSICQQFFPQLVLSKYQHLEVSPSQESFIAYGRCAKSVVHGTPNFVPRLGTS